jgi:hypothetical protein
MAEGQGSGNWSGKGAEAGTIEGLMTHRLALGLSFCGSGPIRKCEL